MELEGLIRTELTELLQQTSPQGTGHHFEAKSVFPLFTKIAALVSTVFSYRKKNINHYFFGFFGHKDEFVDESEGNGCLSLGMRNSLVMNFLMILKSWRGFGWKEP